MPSHSLSPGSPSFKLNLLSNKFRKSPSPPPPSSQPPASMPDTPFGSAPSTSSFANYRPGGSYGGSVGSGSSSSNAAGGGGDGPSTRSRSSSQPMRPTSRSNAPSLSRHQSHLNFKDAMAPPSTTIVPTGSSSGQGAEKKKKGRGRSASLVTVTQVGGEEMDGADMGTLGTQNWEWVDRKGAWAIHPILILIGKLVFDSIPGIDPDVSWTLVTCGYMAVSYLIFHQMTGLPFENTMATGGAYDDLTLWEQIDNGAQYTPAKKWLTSVPIGLFLISTHYTKYNPLLFSINTVALACVLIPKLPAVHRLRFEFLGGAEASTFPTPANSRPSSPKLAPTRVMRGSVEPEETILEEDEDSTRRRF